MCEWDSHILFLQPRSDRFRFERTCDELGVVQKKQTKLFITLHIWAFNWRVIFFLFRGLFHLFLHVPHRSSGLQDVAVFCLLRKNQNLKSTWTKTRHCTLQRFLSEMRSPCCFLLSAASLVPQQGTKTTCFTQLSLPQGTVRQFGSVKTLIHWARWFKAFGGHKSAHTDWNCSVILSWYLAAQVAPLKVAETKIACYFMSPSFVTL